MEEPGSVLPRDAGSLPLREGYGNSIVPDELHPVGGHALHQQREREEQAVLYPYAKIVCSPPLLWTECFEGGGIGGQLETGLPDLLKSELEGVGQGVIRRFRLLSESRRRDGQPTCQLSGHLRPQTRTR